MTAQTYTDAQIEEEAYELEMGGFPDTADMFRSLLSERQADRSVVVSDEDVNAAEKSGEPLDLKWIAVALKWIEQDDGFSCVTQRIASSQRFAVEAAIASRHARQVPDGYAMVPIEPTDEMVKAAMDAEDAKPSSSWGKPVPLNFDETYKSMIAAAPPSPEKD